MNFLFQDKKKPVGSILVISAFFEDTFSPHHVFDEPVNIQKSHHTLHSNDRSMLARTLGITDDSASLLIAGERCL